MASAGGRLIHHRDHGSEWRSVAYTREVELVGARMSTGSVEDPFALAETTIGICKTELFARHGPWPTV
jgi:putative transposase